MHDAKVEMLISRWISVTPVRFSLMWLKINVDVTTKEYFMIHDGTYGSIVSIDCVLFNMTLKIGRCGMRGC